MNQSGVYQITNTANGKRYIGSAVNLSKRKYSHFSMLENGIHPNSHFQSAYNKYGVGAFVFEKLQEVPSNWLIVVEQLFLDWLQPEYNTRKVAHSNLGVKHTKESRHNMGMSKIGRRLSEETKNKISKAHIGKKHSIETRRKMREIHRDIKSVIALQNYWSTKTPKERSANASNAARSNRGRSHEE